MEIKYLTKLIQVDRHMPPNDENVAVLSVGSCLTAKVVPQHWK